MDIPEGVLEYYGLGKERDRLERGQGLLEALRTWELLQRWLPAPRAIVLDVGGAAGRYAFPLAEVGHLVHLLDPVSLHLEQAEETNSTAAHRLASISQADARELPFPDGSADAVLLLGPLYHLPERTDRLQAWSEAHRVLRPGGVIVAAAISRWGSVIDGLVGGLLRDPEFSAIVAEALDTGVHRNPGLRPGWFTTAYFHRPDDLREEVLAAGLETEGPVAVEGVARLAPDLDALLDDPVTRSRVLDVVRATETEPALLGASAHLLIAGHKPH